MQPNPKSDNRSALLSASHSKSYDPSAYYRALMMPPPPPVNTNMPSNNPYSSNPNASQDVPATNIDPKTGVAKRIPQFYYPRYNDADDPHSKQPNFVEPRETNPNLRPPVVEQQVPNGYPPYAQPPPWSMDPYAPGQHYPYSTPYLIPLTTNIPPADHASILQEQSKADVIAAHQKDADISRLEVYHFTPKQNTSLSMGTAPAPPMVQYHVYPYPPAPAAPPPPIPAQQQFPPYPPPWYAYPPNVPPYLPEPSQPELPFIETKARASQTEQPSTKSRGVSPIRFSPPTPPPIYDDDGYPYIHQRTLPTDRYNITTGRINQRFYDNSRSPPLADCRCLDCQRERTKALNYYPD